MLRQRETNPKKKKLRLFLVADFFHLFSAKNMAEKKFYLPFLIICSVISTRPRPLCFQTLICAAHCITFDVGAFRINAIFIVAIRVQIGRGGGAIITTKVKNRRIGPSASATTHSHSHL